MNKFIIIFVLVFGISVALNYYEVQEIEDIIVEDILTQQNISTTNGSQSTEYHYLVITNKGTFEISPDGIYSAGNSFGKVKQGDTINVITRGYGLEIFGIFPYIIVVK